MEDQRTTVTQNHLHSCLYLATIDLTKHPCLASHVPQQDLSRGLNELPDEDEEMTGEGCDGCDACEEGRVRLMGRVEEGGREEETGMGAADGLTESSQVEHVALAVLSLTKFLSPAYPNCLPIERKLGL